MDSFETREANLKPLSTETTTAAAAENAPVVTLQNVAEVTHVQDAVTQPPVESVTAAFESADAAETETAATEDAGFPVDDDQESGAPVGIDPSLLSDTSYQNDLADDDMIGIVDYEYEPQPDFWVPTVSPLDAYSNYEYTMGGAGGMFPDTPMYLPLPPVLVPEPGAVCFVCSEAFSAAFPALQVQCGHHFCHDCLLSWAQSCVSAGKVPNCPMCRSPHDVPALPSPVAIASGGWDERLLFRYACADALYRHESGFTSRARWQGSQVVQHHREELYTATYMYACLTDQVPEGAVVSPSAKSLLLLAIWQAIDEFEEGSVSMDVAYRDLMARAMDFIADCPDVGLLVKSRTCNTVARCLDFFIRTGMMMAAELAKPPSGTASMEVNPWLCGVKPRIIFWDGCLSEGVAEPEQELNLAM